MAIEPLGSIMSVQAQNTVPKKQAVAENSTANESAVVPGVAQVDKVTNVVENAKGKGQANGGDDKEQTEQKNEQIRKAVEKLNKNMAHSEAVFGIHEDTNRVTIKIVDKDTKEVIKELPPEKTLDMIARVWELAGIMVDERR